MAGPKTIDDEMSVSDLLQLRCGACGFTFEATRQQAIRRYGRHACIVVINMTSTCPECGDKRSTWARLLPGEAHRRALARRRGA